MGSNAPSCVVYTATARNGCRTSFAVDAHRAVQNGTGRQSGVSRRTLALKRSQG